MTRQIRNFTFRVAMKVNLYQLFALGLALGVGILGMPGGGGGSGA